MKGSIALKGFYFIRKSFTWKSHINPKPKKPDTRAAINWVGRGAGASAPRPEELGAPVRSAQMSPRPCFSFCNAAACGRAGDGWQRGAEPGALGCIVPGPTYLLRTPPLGPRLYPYSCIFAENPVERVPAKGPSYRPKRGSLHKRVYEKRRPSACFFFKLFLLWKNRGGVT